VIASLLGILTGSTVVVSICNGASRSRHLRAASPPAPHHQRTQFIQKQVTSVVDSPLYLPHWRPSPPSLFRDSPLQLPEIDFYLKPDHGELIIKELHDASIGRVIDPMDYQTAETYRELLLEIADKVYVSSHWWPSDDRDYYEGKCVRPTWSLQPKPNCNTIHETVQMSYAAADGNDPTASFNTSHLAQVPPSRESYVLTSRQRKNHDESLVLIQVQLATQQVANQGMQHRILSEALVLEATSASRHSAAIYSHCSTSLLVEAATTEISHNIVPFNEALQEERGRMSQDRLDLIEEAFGGGPHSLNNYTAVEKLDIILEMVQGLAELHGHSNGVIVHDQVHPDQWSRAKDGRLVLNGLNHAFFLGWNLDEERYCPTWVSHGGNFRAPEEYEEEGSWVDEKADLWPVGNLIFSLLTGMFPYYEIGSEHENRIEMATMEGSPFLHPDYRTRSFIEKRLTEIMDQCHVLEPAERADIFTVLEHLKETKRLYNILAQQQSVANVMHQRHECWKKRNVG